MSRLHYSADALGPHQPHHTALLQAACASCPAYSCLALRQLCSNTRKAGNRPPSPRQSMNSSFSVAARNMWVAETKQAPDPQ